MLGVGGILGGNYYIRGGLIGLELGFLSFLLSFLLLEVGWMGVEALIWREREEEEGKGGCAMLG